MTGSELPNPRQGEETGESDQYLAILCQERAAFLTRFFLARGAHHNDVQDLIQETLTVFWTKRAVIQQDKAKAFITGIARNTLLAHKRNTHTHLALTEVHHTEIRHTLHPDPRFADATLHATDHNERLRHLIDRLPPRMAQVLRMHHLEGHSLADIAATLGFSLGYVQKTSAEAMKRLRTLLDED